MKILCIRQFDVNDKYDITALVQSAGEICRIDRNVHWGENFYEDVEELDGTFEEDFLTFKLDFKYE